MIPYDWVKRAVQTLIGHKCVSFETHFSPFGHNYAATVTSKDAPSTGAGKDDSMSDQTGYESADIDTATSSEDDQGNMRDDSYDGGLGFGP